MLKSTWSIYTSVLMTLMVNFEKKFEDSIM